MEESNQQLTQLNSEELSGDFKAFFELSQDVLSINDLSGKILKVNPAACHLFGFTQDEIVGRCYLDIVHPDDRDKVRAELEGHSSSSAGSTMESRIL